MLAGNIISVNNKNKLQGLITIENTLYLYSVWLISEHLVAVA